MYKKLLILFVIGLVFCQISAAYCKGTIKDCDSYDTYIGKSKSEVKQIAKTFKQTDDDSVFLIDAVGDQKEYVLLIVGFNKNNKVNSVAVSFPETMADSKSYVFDMGLTFLGINTNAANTRFPRYHIFSEPYEDVYYAALDSTNLCKCYLHNGLYSVVCYDNEESLKYFDITMKLYDMEKVK